MTTLHGCRRAWRPALSALAVTAMLAVAAGQASAATLTVCRTGCAHTRLAAAAAAARDGDVIALGAGTYAGGVTIDASVRLVGAGSGSTVIAGGGPVLTIGEPDAATEPTVSISGVTVTGGVTIGNLTPSRGRGGGLYIPRAAGPSTGATVTVRDSVIRDNSVAPRVADEGDDPCCAFADSGGGGISNDGNLTLERTSVVDNVASDAGGLASNAIGAGILNRTFGTLTIRDSVLAGNHAAVTPPNGRFAAGAGIAMVGGSLTIADSRVSANTADTRSAVPAGVDQEATAAGIQVQGAATATIRRTDITGNSATSTNTVGDALAFSGGLHADGSVVLRDDAISDNHVAATAAPGFPANAEADSGAGELNADSTISSTRFIGNTVTATATAGTAAASAGASVTAAFNAMTMANSVIGANRVTATSANGAATAHGGGIANIGALTLRGTTIAGNSAAARAPRGEARGGGIYNGAVPDGPPLTQLALVGTTVTRNALSAGADITAQGGGVFSLFPVTLVGSAIVSNVPDQCTGC